MSGDFFEKLRVKVREVIDRHSSGELVGQDLQALLDMLPRSDVDVAKRLRAQIAEHATPATSARVPGVVTVDRADLEQVLAEVERVTTAAKDLEEEIERAQGALRDALEVKRVHRDALLRARVALMGVNNTGDRVQNRLHVREAVEHLDKILAVVAVVVLALFTSCGGLDVELDLTKAPQGRIETGGRVTPWLSVNGATSPRADAGEWVPTGVAFDARGEGWRLSCLDGQQPSIAAFGDGFLTLKCPAQPVSCPTVAADNALCCPDEVAVQRCVGAQRWVCEPGWTDRPGPTWFKNGDCAPED